MAVVKEKQRPVPEMCLGCARDKGVKCEIITEPGFIYDNRGRICFARVNAARAKQIEKEIAFVAGFRDTRREKYWGGVENG